MADLQNLKWSEVTIAIIVGAACLGVGGASAILQWRLALAEEKIQTIEDKVDPVPMLARDIKELGEKVDDLEAAVKAKNQSIMMHDQKLDEILRAVRTPTP